MRDYSVKNIFNHLIIFIYKFMNFRLYPKSTKLYGIPKIIHKKNVFLGEKIRLNRNIFIHASEKVFIQNNVTISYGTTVFTTGYDLNNWQQNRFEKIHVSKPVTIKQNVWIGANVTILQGVVIEEDIVVAAGSVVNKNLDKAGYLYAGSPARPIKKIL